MSKSLILLIRHGRFTHRDFVSQGRQRHCFLWSVWWAWRFVIDQDLKSTTGVLKSCLPVYFFLLIPLSCPSLLLNPIPAQMLSKVYLFNKTNLMHVTLCFDLWLSTLSLVTDHIFKIMITKFLRYISIKGLAYKSKNSIWLALITVNVMPPQKPLIGRPCRPIFGFL